MVTALLRGEVLQQRRKSELRLGRCEDVAVIGSAWWIVELFLREERRWTDFQFVVDKFADQCVIECLWLIDRKKS